MVQSANTLHAESVAKSSIKRILPPASELSPVAITTAVLNKPALNYVLLKLMLELFFCKRIEGGRTPSPYPCMATYDFEISTLETGFSASGGLVRLLSRENFTDLRLL